MATNKIMFTYNISKNADAEAFCRICSIIESSCMGLKKEALLEDVDGTQIQIYISNEGKIKIYNDYEVDAVYIDSDIDLKNISL